MKNSCLSRLPILLPLLFSLLLAGCSSEPEPTPGPRQYSDEEAEAFLERIPSIVAEYGEKPLPRDILDSVGIDTSELEVIENIIGGCITYYVYDLSPSYELVVDDNACSGYRFAILPKGTGFTPSPSDGVKPTAPEKS